MVEYWLLCITLGILNGLMDDYRDWYPNHLLRRWRYGMRHPDDRNKVKGYIGGSFIFRRIVEVVNDVWHLFKSVIFLSLILFHPNLEGWLIVERMAYLAGCLASFMVAFELVYHKRWRPVVRWFRKLAKL